MSGGESLSPAAADPVSPGVCPLCGAGNACAMASGGDRGSAVLVRRRLVQRRVAGARAAGRARAGVHLRGLRRGGFERPASDR